MKPVLIVFWTLAVLGAARAQQPDAPKSQEKPPQDPKAVAMLERFDALVYSPRAAGLKDLEFAGKLQNGFHLLVRWKAPDRLRADLVVPADTPPDLKKRLDIIKRSHEAEARKTAPAFLVTQLGEVLAEKHKGDELILAAPNQVKIIARSDSSKAEFKEQVVTFNEQGLVTQARVTAPTGVESVLEPTFLEWKGTGKLVLSGFKSTTGKDETTFAFEYLDVGGFPFKTKVTATNRGVSRSLEYTGFKANQGLEDKAFEDQPESAPK